MTNKSELHKSGAQGGGSVRGVLGREGRPVSSFELGERISNID